MKKQFLLLVKHATPAVDASLPAAMWRLSEEGQRSSVVLAEVLRPYQPQRCIASPEPKASETAIIAAQALGLPVKIRRDLHEHLRLQAGFSTREIFEASIMRLFTRPGDLVYGDETADQAHGRFSKAITASIAEYPDETLVVVAHGTVITLFVSRLVGLDPFPFWQRLGLPSVVVLTLPNFELVEVIEQVRI